MIQTINISSVICSQRSLVELLKGVSTVLPDFFGFEGAGLLFVDSKTDDIFAVHELSKEDVVNQLKEKFHEIYML